MIESGSSVCQKCELPPALCADRDGGMRSELQCTSHLFYPPGNELTATPTSKRGKDEASTF